MRKTLLNRLTWILILLLANSGSAKAQVICQENGYKYLASKLLIKSKTEKFKLSESNFGDNEKQIAAYLKHQKRIKKIKAFKQAALKNNFEIDLENKNCDEIKKLRKELTKDDSLAEVNLDYIFEAEIDDPIFQKDKTAWSFSYDPLYGTKIINSEAAWQKSTGEGIVVAVIDTGVDYNHEDLFDNIWVNPKLVSDFNNDGRIDLHDLDKNGNGNIEDNELDNDFIGEDFVDNDASPLDELNGHGTHIAGTIAASANEIGTIGIAYNAKIMPIRVLNNSGRGDFATVARGIIYAVNRGADVLNLSFGAEPNQIPSVIKGAIDYANSKGVVVVAAGGNRRHDGAKHIPSIFENTIGVGGTDPLDRPYVNSNFGAGIDIYAPALNVISTLASGTLINFNPPSRVYLSNSDDYFYISGTSTATAHVAAVAALIKAVEPQLTNKSFKTVLSNSSVAISSSRDISAKRLDAAQALAQMVEIEDESSNEKSFYVNLTQIQEENDNNVIDYHLRSARNKHLLSLPIAKFNANTRLRLRASESSTDLRIRKSGLVIGKKRSQKSFKLITGSKNYFRNRYPNQDSIDIELNIRDIDTDDQENFILRINWQ